MISNNHRDVEYSYRFLVNCGDKTVESIETFTKYELEGDKCRALRYNGKVLVDEAQVKELPRKLFSI